ncbi:MAG: NAD(+) synthase [Caulobacteraceae bacterium]
MLHILDDTDLPASEWLKIDVAAEADRIAGEMRAILSRDLKRRGFIIGMSGGIDSSVSAALAVKAVGKDRVFGLHMPEGESSDDSLRLSRLLADQLGIKSTVENITGVLQGAGCYQRRDDAVRLSVPDFGPGWKLKVVMPNVLDTDTYQVSQLVVQPPVGEPFKVRPKPETYAGVVAATNFKQRTRKMLEYYWADVLNYAVIGTPNGVEYDQGFFVKGGDGAADIKPIAHLYKSQVYALAEHLGVPAEIRARPPSTDTFSLEQTQEEFYYALPYDRMDIALFGKNRNLPAEKVAVATGLTVDQLQRIWKGIDAKRATTRYLHLPPVLVDQLT